jgi:hypothetical protein
VLGVQTAGSLLSLIGLWILRTILVNLDFVTELAIPELKVDVATIISGIFYVLVLVVLARFARILTRLWPEAFPSHRQVVLVWHAMLYLIVLSAVYDVSRPIFAQLDADPEIFTLWQVLLVILALVISIWVCAVVQRCLPGWLLALRTDVMGSAEEE